jgi:hypothetical protein
MRARWHWRSSTPGTIPDRQSECWHIVCAVAWSIRNGWFNFQRSVRLAWDSASTMKTVIEAQTTFLEMGGTFPYVWSEEKTCWACERMIEYSAFRRTYDFSQDNHWGSILILLGLFEWSHLGIRYWQCHWFNTTDFINEIRNRLVANLKATGQFRDKKSYHLRRNNAQPHISRSPVDYIDLHKFVRVSCSRYSSDMALSDCCFFGCLKGRLSKCHVTTKEELLWKVIEILDSISEQ